MLPIFGGLRLTARTSQASIAFSTRLSMQRGWSSLSIGENALIINSLGTTFPYVWLRDSCQAPTCVHPSTSQKLHRTSDIPLDIKPIPDGVQLVDDGLRIQWVTGHKSFYPRSFLERHSSTDKLSKFHKDLPQEPWSASGISKNPNLFLQYKTLQEPTGLLTAVNQLSVHGLLFVKGVPNTETSSEICELRKLAAYFGEIRETFYGQVWDVKNVSNSRNIAYTNLDLGLHMDLLYFQHPPRYQILHCLRNRVVGGMSIFVDSLRAATTLRTNHPTDFETLATTPVAFHYINDGHHLHYEHPTIELSGPVKTSILNAAERPIHHINYSPPFQAPHLLSSTLPAFYPALARFASLLEAPDSTYMYTLEEGDAVLFDNRRVLHARTSFQDRLGEEVEKEDTNRWLKGCYLEADALLDRARVLRAKADGGLL